MRWLMPQIRHSLHALSPKQIGVIALICTTTLWSTLGIYIRILDLYFPLLQQVYLRMIVATLLIYIIGARSIKFERLMSLTRWDWALLVGRSICMYLLGVVISSIAYLTGEYSSISLVKALPITAVLGFLLFNEKVTLLKVFFVLLSFGGAFLLITPDLTSLAIWGKGELLALASATFLAFSYASRKWQSSQINNWESSFLLLLLSIPMLVFTSFLLGEKPLFAGNLVALPVLFAIGASAILNAVGLFSINYALEHIDIVLSNNIFALQPLFGVLVGVLLYQDKITLWEAVGGVIIILSLIGMNNFVKPSR